jgi:hypothetical protein
MLITITVTLVLFIGYHIWLISHNMSTNEKTKQGKMIKYMHLIRDTLKALAKEKGYDYNKKEKELLSNEDIERYKNIAFNSKFY